ncbi:MAG: DUF3810 domain-containing protein [Planctomycetes bacterium]|nr:DUF3810 domain-containing protein [Planctomycetota bacterium]
MGMRERCSVLMQALRAAGRARRRSLLLALSVGVACALLRVAAGAAPEWTERLYSRGLYPWFERGLSFVSGLSPWSLGELGLLALALLAAVRAARVVRERVRGTGRALELACAEFLRVLTLASWSVSFYLLAWGLNHARLPYAHGSGFDMRPAGAEELEQATRDWLQRARDARSSLPENADGTVAIEGDFEQLASSVARAWSVASATDARLAGSRPVLRDGSLSLAMKLAGISGIYWPFTAEPHVNTLAPVPQRMFSALHEVAHQRGFAREDEANFLAVHVGTLSGDPALAYSVALVAMRELHRALRSAAPERARQVERAIPAPLRRDIDALNAFWAPRSAAQRAVRSVSTKVNDTYLVSQGQRHGVASYGRMVDLLIAQRRRLTAPASPADSSPADSSPADSSPADSSRVDSSRVDSSRVDSSRVDSSR